MNNKKVIVYVISFLILSSFAYAITFNLNQIMYPFRNIDIASFYVHYSDFIDAIIYLILFLSLSQIVFLKIYKGENEKKSAKTISVAISLILTVSMIIVEMKTGFYLGMLEPVALIVFLLLIAMLLYNLLGGLFGDENKGTSASLTYLVVWGLLVVPFGKLNQWIEKNAGILSAILSLAALVAFIYLVIQLFNLLTRGVGSAGKAVTDSGIPGWFKKGPTDPSNTGGGTGPAVHTVVITVPTTAGCNVNDTFYVTFDTTGSKFNRRYDYDVKLNGTSITGGRITKVSGNHIVCPVPLTGGTAPLVVAPSHTITVETFTGGIFGGKPIQHASVTFPVLGGGGGGLATLNNLIANDYTSILSKLDTDYDNYATRFNQIIQMHHEFITGVAGSADPGPVEWNSLQTLRNTMNTTANAPAPTASANSILNSISSHPSYTALTSGNIMTLTDLMNKHSILNNKIITFTRDATLAYNAGRGPVRIP